MLERAGYPEAPHRPAEGVLHGPYGLRAGWRIALYLLLTLGFGIVATGVAALLGFDPGSLDVSAAIGLMGALAAGWMMLALVDRRPIGALGFAADPAAARDSVAGFGIGGGMQLLAVAMLAVAGTARWVADSGTAADYVATLAQAFALFTVAAAMEEALFRGYFFQALVQGIGAWPAILVSSVLFAAGHLANPNVTAISLANIFLAGVWLAVCYLRTRSLWFATAAHLAWNWVMSALLDFPVSGLVRDTPLYSARELGADWWTGGVFGPEGGVAATAVILAGTLWLLRTRAVGESAKMRELRPLVDDCLGKEWPR